ncbi:hypothetical protein H632_c2513p0 [Helicosporidium sp. ATCC 50920]|nr:hypothetical protein H632_c2513p0 [Helicosporidium sp. ATCC 50920]|eukprot:KDD73119.1 hypothetical protein H632_c2513p0 [Helicosporidium sp. ATCC 50920]
MMDNGLAPSIRRLDEDVVRRIAAGEVIQRPANALKELIENSIDAGATNITVTVKDGGLKMLQVADNGHGIKEVDFPLLCERHATSKLSSFADLEGIQTLGFRGEALASISYVSHVTVTSQTVGSALGLRASFHDGCMDGAPAPCAGVQGTTILAEDLFYNAPLRRKAMRGAGEEYALILEAAGAHALHSPGVAFVCRRAGEPRAELQTLGSGSRRDAVRALYGHSAARSLLDLAFAEEPEGLSPRAGAAAGLSCAVSGLMTGPEYSGKKLALVLFVNGRPVESGVLKRAVEAGYSAVLPKGVNPFVFLQVQVPPAHVDVNTHPTKRSVRLLHQAELAERLREAVQNLLLSSNDARAFVQSQMPGAPAVEEEARTAPSAYYRPEKLVRVDARAQTLHAFLTPAGGEGRGPFSS